MEETMARFPCEEATEEELFKAVQVYGKKKLRRMVCLIDESTIPWASIQHLCVWGKEDQDFNWSLKAADLEPGIYINCMGSFLLLVHPDNREIQLYMDRFGSELKTLAIRDIALSELDCSSLSELTSLTLYNCRYLIRLVGLKKLVNLTELVLRGCSQLMSLSGLKCLIQLTTLDLSWCEQLTSLPGLRCLTQLTALDLSGCKQLMALPGLKHLTQLMELYLAGCRLLTSLPGLEHLAQLTTLDLHGCRYLRSLSGLEHLAQLTTLDLSWCDQLTSLSGLEHLVQLTTLDLSECKLLTSLPGLEHLVQLTTLDFSECKLLTSLPDLEHLTQLERLDLSGCSSLRKLPDGICNLKNLRRLMLREMKLETLPDWLTEIAESFSLVRHGKQEGTEKAAVYLYGTTVDDIPDMSIFDQPYEMVVKFFEERRLGRTRLINEIKVVFLGDGEAGKSYTIARLMNDGGEPVDYMDLRTPGIEIKKHPCEWNGRNFHVNYWDFGGQEIMHAMHRVFLTERTMYVVLVDGVSEHDPEEQARNWLDNIQSFAPNAPVLLAINKIDRASNVSLKEDELKRQYPNLKRMTRMSALKDDPERFDQNFQRILLEEIVATGYLDAQWPGAWLDVKNRMENLGKNYITVREYEKICTECQVDDIKKELLDWFNDLGISFCCRDNYRLKRQVVLQPRWITNGLYIILFNQFEGFINGMVPRESIHDLLERASSDPTVRCTDPGAEYEIPRDAEFVLDIMRQFGLSYPAGEDREFIPMLCREEPMLKLDDLVRDEAVQEFHMEFSYLPSNVLYRLMVERYSELDKDCVWRTGARLELSGTGLSAVVAMDGNILRFFIRHTDDMHRSNTCLTMLKDHVERIAREMGLQGPVNRLIYKLGGKRDEFDYEDVELNRELGDKVMTSRAHKKKILIEDILNQNPPAGHQEEKNLLECILRACYNIQAEPSYRGSDEDQRNRRIRDDLVKDGYRIHDQSQRGVGRTGRGPGELDLLLENAAGEPWTMIEALRVHDGGKREWEVHLVKLLGGYNYAGWNVAYLLTYVDGNEKKFMDIWETYPDHIRCFHPGPYSYEEGSYEDLNTGRDLNYICKARCVYKCGDARTTVYHLFVMVKPR